MTTEPQPQPPATAEQAALLAPRECVGLCVAAGASWADIYATVSVAVAASAGRPEPGAVPARLSGLLTAVIAAMEARR